MKGYCYFSVSAFSQPALRRDDRAKKPVTTKINSSPTLINNDMTEAHTDNAPSLKKLAASAIAEENIHNIGLLCWRGETTGEKAKAPMTKTAKGAF